MRLYINIDHVATIRQARRGDAPDPVAAALLCEQAGADGITAHLREDRRHIQDDDVERLARTLTTDFNLEMACTPEMLDIALQLRPFEVTLVPERRQEITTEGGLDVRSSEAALRRAVERLQKAGIKASLFIDPAPDAVERSHAVGTDAVELHTGTYAHAPDVAATLDALQQAAATGRRLGLAVHAGHGLTTANVGRVAAIPEIEELNIGHSVVGRALSVGMVEAVRELRTAIDAGRRG